MHTLSDITEFVKESLDEIAQLLGFSFDCSEVGDQSVVKVNSVRSSLTVNIPQTSKGREIYVSVISDILHPTRWNDAPPGYIINTISGAHRKKIQGWVSLTQPLLLFTRTLNEDSSEEEKKIERFSDVICSSFADVFGREDKFIPLQIEAILQDHRESQERHEYEY